MLVLPLRNAEHSGIPDLREADGYQYSTKLYEKWNQVPL